MGYRESTTDPNRLTDDQAIVRYKYMLATAPPEDIERAHEEAFARLTPEQRRAVLDRLAERIPPTEIRGDDPASLARTATRAEMREPGMMERTFSGWSGPGLGSYFLSSLAGAFIGSAIAQSFFGGDSGADASGVETAESGAEAAESGHVGDVGDGGDFADAGDFGGGDFGDFGGGDIGF